MNGDFPTVINTELFSKPKRRPRAASLRLLCQLVSSPGLLRVVDLAIRRPLYCIEVSKCQEMMDFVQFPHLQRTGFTRNKQTGKYRFQAS